MDLIEIKSYTPRPFLPNVFLSVFLKNTLMFHVRVIVDETKLFNLLKRTLTLC